MGPVGTRELIIGLGLKGTLSEDGIPHISGHAWDSPQALVLVKAAAVPDAELFRYQGAERFDVLPLLVATDGAPKARQIVQSLKFSMFRKARAGFSQVAVQVCAGQVGRDGYLVVLFWQASM